ncbi:Uncharacterised protein [Mycobacteroides abscessus subsp. massiliense]|nr:hypothetical protein [Mycobacteroides abscessus]MDM2426943.1 hypothetical protein [Mycobacteroides abscessus]MDM2436661.1 hypothetical protein [Mycobacteroides abscessus]MDM2438960.1 hypothetical protein [Mycobacteroides abscessus]SKM17201.1 Uncharacterised protein [Mycobacteroides abscessus subsp. massiliense]
MTDHRGKPVADYSPNTCGHPKAYYCRERGCMAILELGCKGFNNMLCGYKEVSSPPSD